MQCHAQQLLSLFPHTEAQHTPDILMRCNMLYTDCMLSRLMQFKKAELHDKGKAADSLLMARKGVMLHYPPQCSLPV